MNRDEKGKGKGKLKEKEQGWKGEDKGKELFFSKTRTINKGKTEVQQGPLHSEFYFHFLLLCWMLCCTIPSSQQGESYSQDSLRTSMQNPEDQGN